MFKFNFNMEEQNEHKQSEAKSNESAIKSQIELKENENSCEAKSEEVPYLENTEILCFIQDLKCIIVHSDFSVQHYDSVEIKRKLLEKQVKASFLDADNEESDLIPSVYEGGMKVWECTFDLLKYIVQKIRIKGTLKDKRVLDLGCGAGLLGIFCAIYNAEVHFQDYNIDVIKYITQPNFWLNMKNVNDSSSMKVAKFYSGDWHSFAELLQRSCDTEETKFDWILTSETIYNVKNYDKLINVFRLLLKKNGTVYLAAKEHYFGIGGGLTPFRQHLDKCNLFDNKIIEECSSGLKRAILEITFKK